MNPKVKIMENGKSINDLQKKFCGSFLELPFPPINKKKVLKMIIHLIRNYFRKLERLEEIFSQINPLAYGNINQKSLHISFLFKK